jgi:hypothetical protein
MEIFEYPFREIGASLIGENGRIDDMNDAFHDSAPVSVLPPFEV